ncbi:histone H1 [Sporobolomyces salmoneus]|uniref:histone H1 n=1 Tax=Sporobolomyces salmoneus TaxID=183962 RepID=UPI00317BA593
MSSITAAEQQPHEVTAQAEKAAAPSSKKQGTSSSTKAKRAHPTYQDMIIQAIEEVGEKGSASRPVIKKYILNRYGLNDTHQFDGHVATAIRRGHDNGIFDYPKGPSGKIKLSAKAKAKSKTDHSKENAAPEEKKFTISGSTARTRELAKQTAAVEKEKKKKVKATTALKPKKKVTSKKATAAKTTSTTTAANKKKAGGKVSPVVEVPAKKSSAAKKSGAKKAPARTASKKTASAKK